MTTCEHVRPALPGFVTGEPDEDGVREHLRGCAPCRAEHAALVRDLERLRSDLAPLAPSDALELAVLQRMELAERTPTRSREPRPVSWTVAIAALAAVVAAAFVLPHWLGGGEPEASGVTQEAGKEGDGADRGPTLVKSPAPAWAIADARTANGPLLADPNEAVAGDRVFMQGVFGETTGGFGTTRINGRLEGSGVDVLAPMEMPVVHRWIYGYPGAMAGDRSWAMPDGPKYTVLFGRASGLVPRLSESGEFEVGLASPDGGTQARVNARYDPAFEGGVWIPDPLGRALDLHQFEIPGRASAVSPTGEPRTVAEVVGQRARVRARVAALGYDRVVEAFVPTDGRSRPLDPNAPTHVFELEGVGPLTAYAATDALRAGGDVSIAMRHDGVTRRVEGGRFSFEGYLGAHLAVAEEPEGGQRRVLFLGHFVPAPAIRIRTERLVLPGPFPVGAHATAACVWRGRTARPSGEGVSQATVALDGSLTFLRRSGVSGELLRVRVVSQEGKVSWHDVRSAGRVAAGEGAGVQGDADARVGVGDAPLYLHVQIGPDGRVSLRSTTGGAKPVWNDHGAWTFSVDDPEGAMGELKGLHAAFRGLLHDAKQAPTLWTADAHSRALLLVEPAAAALWRYAQWAIATGASPQTKVFRLAFRTFEPAGWIDIELSKDRGIDPAPVAVKPPVKLEVKLFRQNLERPPGEQYTRVKVARPRVQWVEGHELVIGPDEPPPAEQDSRDVLDLPVASEKPEVHAARWKQVEERLRALAKADSPLLGEVKAPFPKGLGVPYGDAATVLQLLRRVGCADIRLEGAPPPKLTKEGGGWGFHDSK